MKLLGMTIAELQDVAAKFSLPRFAARQIAQWMYRKHVTSVLQMTNLSLAARTQLKAAGYEVGYVEPLQTQRSIDGTEKFLFPTESGQQVETVLIHDNERRTLCISTQVG